jgi:hypothetical protein
MTIDRRAIGALVSSVLLLAVLQAQGQLVAFRDPNLGTWGYKGPDGSVVIPPRYVGAGVFQDGHAPVQDANGFAIIDETGRTVERIAIDSVSPSAEPISPPTTDCVWSGSVAFPSTGLQCYVRQLRGAAPVVGGEITIRPGGGESSRAAIVLKLPNGVVVVENIGYEGFTRRVLLPGISAEQALEWRRRLYPDIPPKIGCSESWNTGTILGGAFIEQLAGC